jgi:hypothetical protein
MPTKVKADDPVAILAAARDHLAEAERAVADRKVDFDADTTALQIAVDKATAAAKRVGAGEDVDPKESARLKLTVALARETVEFSRTALDEAERLAAAAFVKKEVAQLAVLDQRALRLHRPAGEDLIDVQAKAESFKGAVEKARASEAARLHAKGEAEYLRLRLAGIDPATRPFDFPHTVETRRFLAALPAEWMFEIHVSYPVGDVRLDELGRRYIATADAA